MRVLAILAAVLLTLTGQALDQRRQCAFAADNKRAAESGAATQFQAFVVSHTHSDFAWLDSIAGCLDRNVAAVAKSVELGEQYPEFRFCMEHMLAVREHLRRHPEKQPVVRKLMKEGRFEAGGFYTGPWELTCGAEGLVRQLYLGKRWVKTTLGADPSIVWNVDVAGHTAQVPQILHKTGIRGLVISAGSSGPGLYRWQSPDGSSVLAWNAPWGYGAGETLGLRHETLDTMIAGMPRFVDEVRRNADEFHLPRIGFIADGFDCLAPSERVVENIRRWNADHRQPQIRCSSTAALFASVENASLPTLRGEMPSPWDSVQSQGNECFILDRRLDGRVAAAEEFAALASAVDASFLYPHDQFATVWGNRLYVMDHNWGGAHGAENDRWKAEQIEMAARLTDKILDRALTAIASRIAFHRPAGGAVPLAVFNPLSWNRKDVVVCRLPNQKAAAARMKLVDGSGKVVPHQLVLDDSGSPTGEVAFLAEVPSIGYSSYYAIGNQQASAVAGGLSSIRQLNPMRIDTTACALIRPSAASGASSTNAPAVNSCANRANTRATK